MPEAQGIQEEGAGGSIHNPEQLHSLEGLQKALILAVFMNVDAVLKLLGWPEVKGRWGCTK